MERTSTLDDTLSMLRAAASDEFRTGMTRFGIAVDRALGVHIPEVRAIAKRIGTNHRLAMELFDSGVHEAQILASIVADRRLFTPEDMDCWVADFDSWDVCDQCCMNLFRRLPFAYEKVRFYAAAEREFTRRAGFALLATLAVGDKSASDDVFRDFLPLTEEYSVDPRPSIRKAVNWALRQIGKRNSRLHPAALAAAERIAASGTASARWIGRDAVRELRSEGVLRRLGIDGL
ncbi:MAG: DNA alkylation repair protein [Alistipes sp.]|nr:DNA alkylation repair protein [Alistipes sp.]